MIRALDIFCGGGGSSYGARDAGVEIAAGIDICRVATQTFRDNFPHAQAIRQKLEHVNLKMLRDRIGDVEILLASPECTSHTPARGKAPKSEESRATAMQVLRYARFFKPRWLVIENVIQMRRWPRYQEFLDALRKEGYSLEEHVLIAADYGVPQRRQRLFVLCDRSNSLPQRIPKSRGRKPAARSILDKPGTWTRSLLDNGNRATATLNRAERGFAALGRYTPFIVVYYGSDGGGGWQSLNSPLRTITTLDRFGLVEPSEDGPTLRMLQVPELRRAMGFGKDFKLERGTRRERIKILGNGVCPPVMNMVVRALVASS